VKIGMSKPFLCLTCKYQRPKVPEELNKPAISEVREIPTSKVTEKMVCNYLQELEDLFEAMKEIYPNVIYCFKHHVVVAGSEGIPTQVRSECPDYEEMP